MELGNKEFWIAFLARELDSRRVLTIPNAEIRREVMEHMDMAKLMASATIIDKDVDKQGNMRALLHLPCEDAEHDILAAIRVMCPTSGRVYHLLVDPQSKTCQEAVASTWGMSAEEYNPIYES